MSLFDFFGKMVKGEPIFSEPQGQSQNQQEGSGTKPAGPGIQKWKSSSFPEASITHVKVHENGSRIQVYCRIRNTWHEPVLLDKIHIFSTKRELDTDLRAGEEREFLVYDGPKLMKEYHESRLDYKTHREGDYFQALHDVEYTYRPDDHTYAVRGFHLRHPILDIYG